MEGLYLFASFFLGTSIANIVSSLLIQKLGINLFSAGLTHGIPALSTELAQAKTFDILNYALTILATMCFYGINCLLLQKKRNKVLALGVLGFSFAMFLQTQLVAFSGIALLVLTVAFYLFIALLNWKSVHVRLKLRSWLILANALLLGMYLVLIMNFVTTAIVVSLSIFVSTTVVYLLFSKKIGNLLKSHFHSLFLLSLFVPTNLPALLGLGIITTLAIVLLRSKWNREVITNSVYPLLFVLLLSYNPLFYMGKFDSVEEGFWYGWMQHLIQGDALYKDVMVYHPPFIVWGMYVFNKVAGFSIVNARLYLHILQIAGISMLYLAASTILEKKYNRIVILFLILGMSSLLVRNNIEIRIGLGMLSIAAAHMFFETQKRLWLFVSGLITATSVFVSVEVGAATSIALSAGVLFLSGNRRIYNAMLFASGALSVAIPTALILGVTGGLSGLTEQLAFYSGAFSQGYFNSAIERQFTSSFFHWHIFNQYLSLEIWLWYVAQLGILSALLFAGRKVIERRANPREKTALIMAIMGLIVFRAALGRSDWFHLLFPLFVALPLLFYVIERVTRLKPVINVLVAFAFLFVFARNSVHANFIENVMYRLQTYGKSIGTFNTLNTPRGGIVVGSEVNTEEVVNLVNFIQSNTSKSDTIFVYPWSPELYFLTDRGNATSVDTPYAFYTEAYQNKIVEELQSNQPKYLIYNPDMKFAGLVPETLSVVNGYILQNYKGVQTFGLNQVLEVK